MKRVIALWYSLVYVHVLAFWCYETVQIHTSNLKLHLITRLMKNHIIHAINHLLTLYLEKCCICTSFQHDLPLPQEKSHNLHNSSHNSPFLWHNLPLKWFWIFYHTLSKGLSLDLMQTKNFFNVFFCSDYYILYLQVNLNLQSSTLMYIHLAQFVCHFWMKKKTGDLPSL